MGIARDLLETLRRDGNAEKATLVAVILISGMAAFTPIAPPWPGRTAVALLSVVASALVAGAAYLSGSIHTRLATRWLIAALLVLTLILYLIFLNVLVLRGEVANETVVRGFWCTERALQIKIIAQRCPLLSEDDLLGKDFDVEFFWPPLAIAASRTLLLASWLTLCATLTWSAANFGKLILPKVSRSSLLQAKRADIFISYSSSDSHHARTLCAAIEKRGMHCWIAFRDVGAGDNFQEAIYAAIRSAKVLVLVFTGNTNGSAEVTKELALASQFGLVVLPARIENVLPAAALAYELTTRQWIDFFDDWARGLNRLCARLAEVLRADVSSEPRSRSTDVEA